MQCYSPLPQPHSNFGDFNIGSFLFVCLFVCFNVVVFVVVVVVVVVVVLGGS